MMDSALVHYGDVIALPFFLAGVYYFGRIRRPTMLERVLHAFCLAGLVIDLVFSLHFLTRREFSRLFFIV